MRAVVGALLLLAPACVEDGPSPGAPALPDATPAPQAVDAGPAAPRPDAGAFTPVSYPKECPDLYAQDLLPTFEIEIAEDEWASMIHEYETWQDREAAGLPLKPYHPLIAFRHGDDVATTAMVRLRGNPCCSWSDDKLQLQISFNEIDPDARFHGLRKIILDAPRYNRSFLRERIALSLLRDLGLAAPCANNARLLVNGEYYGLYTNLEKVDHEFLERNFEDPSGPLYKKGHELRSNDEAADWERLDAFWAATGDIAELDALADLEVASRAWAAEAMLPDNDGYWAGGGNYYLYDHPERGFVYIPWDFDSTLDVMPADTDPLTWQKPDGTGRLHFALLVSDPAWLAHWLTDLEAAAHALDPEVLEARVDTWAAQIEEAALADPMKPFTNESHLLSVQNLRGYFAPRRAFLDAWFAHP